MSDQPSDAIEVPEDWNEMTEEEQTAWVTAALKALYKD